MIVGFISFLFQDKPRYSKAAFVSLAILGTTSGMGIALVAAVWAWHLLTCKRYAGFSRKIMMIFGAVFVGVFMFFILSQLSFFNLAIQRVFGSVDGYNAIWGRTLYWDMYITSLTGSDLIFGLGYTALPDIYFTGLMRFIYCYGIVGTALFYLSTFSIFLFTRGFSRCLIFVFSGILLIANLTGFITMIFYFCLAFAGFITNSVPNKFTTAQSDIE
ncbi:hypothetical protein SDC9_130573 [bioreactor metagenome]|uniref:Uncharacterized protein n=1 Tax=bioreactor metagenome TaxID=1076179 RepID=A0A645D2T0_9ZZZZ